MPLVLLRVDERLIHGQVVVAWGGKLRPQRIVVADDALAVSEWEQDLYRLGVSPGTESEFLPVAAAREHLPQWRGSTQRVILLVRGIADLVVLGENAALAGEEVNLGGVHYAAGREAVLPYLYLSSEEQQALSLLAQAGVRISACDVPGSRRIPLEDLLAGLR